MMFEISTISLFGFFINFQISNLILIGNKASQKNYNLLILITILSY